MGAPSQTQTTFSGVSPSSPSQITLVVPIHNEEESLDRFFQTVLPILHDITPHHEVVCVNDGSTDGSWRKLLAARAENPKIKIIDLSRNFGKELALTAGMDHASGAAVIPFDADLQDPPELIPEMVQKWREGYDMVIAVRVDRSSDSRLKRTTAHFFYKIINVMSDIPIQPHAGDFRLLDRKVVDALGLARERTRFMKGLFAWQGFSQTFVTYARPSRMSGTSKWNYWKLWNLALEGIFSFSSVPLRVWTYVGGVITLISLVYMSFIVLRTLIKGIDVPGYASLLVFNLFFSGVILIGLGVIGEYLGRVFIEVKRRPLYLVREAIGWDAVMPVQKMARRRSPYRRRKTGRYLVSRLGR
ncbi:MAG: glycosyltransferase family 2 protein [Magnetococcales bacterium]|nr:glycosyltransferase family 2 protein [Magnetococcales bacterium]MBF0322959.1 glycosyltransferase family 2 protein [Magnetococcales bacterium]